MTGADRRRPGGLDLGRIVMVPAATAIILLDLRSLAGVLASGCPAVRGCDPALTALAKSVPIALACLFYALIGFGYLRRGPARATSGSLAGAAAAVAGTVTPLALPLLPGTPPGDARAAAAGALGLAGLAWAIWSLRTLDRNLSVLAQAREVVERGPYRLVRHPLYAGEMACALGVAIGRGTIAALSCWLACCALQAYRARTEERLLRRTLPGYSDYADHTPALLPVARPGRRRRCPGTGLSAGRAGAAGGGTASEPVGD